MSIVNQPLAFVDIETTGGSPFNARVLEVGIVRVEQSRVVRQYRQLVHPSERIPAFITRLTGITDAEVADAPTFSQAAPELVEILEGAVFVAHNARFDYSFMKAEFERLGVPFNPKLLCTVRLSRTLFPEYHRHRLQDLIDRHCLVAPSRHRAYDDAHVMWQFYQMILREFDLETVDEAIKKQWRQPSLPSQIDATLVNSLPEAPGIYIFEGDEGPVYVGKSVNIKKRVQSHFSADHSSAKEMRIAQLVRNIKHTRTHGELGALLLEAETVKDLYPTQNRQLLRRSSVTLVTRHLDPEGYYRASIANATTINPDDVASILGVYSSAGRAREAMFTLCRNMYLCPKLMNLEKAKAACFQVQLKKCRGACCGQEDFEEYNQRFEIAFEQQRLSAWPYDGPIIITERRADMDGSQGFVVDNWCLVETLTEMDDSTVSRVERDCVFDLDMYKILRTFITNPRNRRHIRAYRPSALVL